MCVKIFYKWVYKIWINIGYFWLLKNIIYFINMSVLGLVEYIGKEKKYI